MYEYTNTRNCSAIHRVRFIFLVSGAIHEFFTNTRPVPAREMVGQLLAVVLPSLEESDSPWRDDNENIHTGHK